MRISDWSSDVFSSDLLVGLDLGHDVAGFDGVAFLDEPLGQRTLFHRGRQRRHLDLDRHLSKSPPARRYRVRMPRARASAQRNRRPRSLPSRSEEHTSELQSLMRISYAVFCLKKKKIISIYVKSSKTVCHNYSRD